MNFDLWQANVENILREIYLQGKADAQPQWYSPNVFKPQKGKAVVIELRELSRDYKTVGYWCGGDEWVVGFQDDRVTSQDIWQWTNLPTSR
jgi:hypothetical protein